MYPLFDDYSHILGGYITSIIHFSLLKSIETIRSYAPTSSNMSESMSPNFTLRKCSTSYFKNHFPQIKRAGIPEYPFPSIFTRPFICELQSRQFLPEKNSPIKQ